MIVKCASVCDKPHCANRSGEYVAFPTCIECNEDVCPTPMGSEHREIPLGVVLRGFAYELTNGGTKRDSDAAAIHEAVVLIDTQAAQIARLTADIIASNHLLAAARAVQDLCPCPTHGRCWVHITNQLTIVLPELRDAVAHLTAERNALKLEALDRREKEAIATDMRK